MRRSIRYGLPLLLCGLVAPGCGKSDSDEPLPGDAGVITQGDAGTDGGTGVDSGVPDAGGIEPGPIDAIIAAMPEGSWKELPNTQMADVCPAPYSSYPCEAVMIAWSGGAYDSLRDRLVVWGGGHDDSPYNNVFTFDLASMKWKRWTELPAGMTGNSVTPVMRDKRVETCGLYPSVTSLDIPDAGLTATGYVRPELCEDPSILSQLDAQQPRSAHMYGNVAFSEASGRFYVLGSVAIYPSGQSGTQRVSGFDFATGRWVRGANNPVVDYGASAADARGHIWYIGSRKLHEYDPVADTWTAHASNGAGYYYAGAAVDTKRNILALVREGTTVSTYALGTPGKTQATVTTTGLSAAVGGAPGLAYSPVLDRFVAYPGGRKLAVLDLQAARWVEVTGTGDDPGPAAANGTYGRFRYSPTRNVFVVVNGTRRNVFIWKPPSTAP
ncbi:hypothetical protein JY651_27010 [Pyxidicoccus parkwayensis]|uniref:Galactose oxidase n=1 Tax=Pyxidicoccus parkwayensis TaxID=2813578 RepID=A0ABX7NS57_9BACT|nr:hypothetical protein [Pyxidicoccus parkwaysis]QSQ18998.1 hypothetical protein JY651_27010 [Pyxidicoccus parkwaysis]